MDAANAASREGRGFARARNAKLHLLAKKKRSQHEQPAAAHDKGGPSCSPSHSSRPVRLSDVLQASPQYFDSYKVSCVEQCLTVIDELPRQCHSAEVVYLSKNNLQTLQGIEQFSQLRVLSASDNLLEDIAQLQILQDACCKLQVVSFERNPITCLPNYRNKVIQMLPKLQMLDGQGISSQDRQRAAAAMAQEAACMAVMVSNACMVHKLVRTAELLQLHTELRRALFGSAAVLRKSFLPSTIPLDLLKFLKLWDYEGSLTAGDRRIITDALTREVVRVHRQLRHAAVQLKGPAQLPELQAWDAAFSQVMLAQQRTIIQLVELVNVLHDEAMRVVASLTPCTQDDTQQQAQEEQEAVLQQHQQEREGLIVDLRDAALELAGVLASNSPPLAGVESDVCAQQYSASPKQLQGMEQMIQQEQQQQSEQLLQQATEAQEQLDEQLLQWSPGSQHQQHEYQQQQELGYPQPMQVQSPQHEPRLQQLSALRAQKPARRLSSNDSLRLRPARSPATAHKPQLQTATACGSSGSAGCASKAATATTNAATADAAGAGLAPIRTKTTPGSPLYGRTSTVSFQKPIPLVQGTNEQLQQEQCDEGHMGHIRSSIGSMGSPGRQPLSTTAQHMLQKAAASATSVCDHHQQQLLPEEEEPQQTWPAAAQQLTLQLPLQPHQAILVRQQQAEWVNAGFAGDTPQGLRASMEEALLLYTARGVDCLNSNDTTSPDGVVLVNASTDRWAEQQFKPALLQQPEHCHESPEEQQQSQSSLSLPASSGAYYEPQEQQEQQQQQQHQQQSSVMRQDHTADPAVTPAYPASPSLQLSEVLPYLAHNNLVYERIERFTPAAAVHGSPAAAAAAASAQSGEDAEPVDVSSMVAAAQTAARQLFAVEGMPGACSFFSPYPAEAQPAQQQQQTIPYGAQAGQSAADPGTGSGASSPSAGAGTDHVLQEAPSHEGAGEISFAYGGSASSSPEEPRSPSRVAAAAAASQQQQQQQLLQRQQQLLKALLSDDESVDDTRTPAAAETTCTAEQHQQQLLAGAAIGQPSGSLLMQQEAAGSQQRTPTAAATVSPADTAAASPSSPLSRGSSPSSSGDFGRLRQRLFASIAVPSPSVGNHKVAQCRPSGLADHIAAQQQQLKWHQQPLAALDCNNPKVSMDQPSHLQQQAGVAVDSRNPGAGVLQALPLQQQAQQQQPLLAAAECSSPRVSKWESLHNLHPQQQQQPSAEVAAGSCSPGVPRSASLAHTQQTVVASSSRDSSPRISRTSTLQVQQQPDAAAILNDTTSENLLKPQKQPQLPVLAPTDIASCKLPLQQLQQNCYEAAAAAVSPNSHRPSRLDLQHAGQQVEHQAIQQVPQPMQLVAQGSHGKSPDVLQHQFSLQASSTSSTSSRMSATGLQQQQQLTPNSYGQADDGTPMVLVSARQSVRGLTLEDWTIQFQPDHQQRGAGCSGRQSASLSQLSAPHSTGDQAGPLSGLDITLWGSVVNPAAGLLRAQSPGSGRSSRASMVEVVAQTLGPGGTPPPLDVASLDYLGSCAASLSPRSSLGALNSTGGSSPMASAQLDAVLNGSVAEAAAVVDAAVEAAAGGSRATSPRPSACAASVPFASIVQQLSSTATDSTTAAGPGRPQLPRQTAAADHDRTRIAHASSAAAIAPAAYLRASALEHAASATTALRPSQLDSRGSLVRTSSSSAAVSQPPTNHVSETVHAAASPATTASAAAAATAATGPPGRASGCATPTKKTLAELQSQLVVLAVEKVALEQQLQIGLADMEQLQEQAAIKEQLEVVVQQMQQDLLAVQERLQQAGNDARQQAVQQQQLLVHMQEVQVKLANRNAQEARSAAADQLSCRALSRRILQHLHQAAITSALWRDFTALAEQHRQQAVQQGVLNSWRCSTRLSKGTRVLQGWMRRRLLQIAIMAWHEGIVLQRLAAERQQAAHMYWYSRMCHKVIAHWRYFTYHVKQLGLEVPSSPSTASDASDAEEILLQKEQEQPEYAAFGGGLAAPAVPQSPRPETSQSSLRSLSAMLSPVLGRNSTASELVTKANRSTEQRQLSAATAQLSPGGLSHSITTGPSKWHSLHEKPAVAVPTAPSVGASSGCIRHRHQSCTGAPAEAAGLLAPQLNPRSAGWSYLLQPFSPRCSRAFHQQPAHGARSRSKSLAAAACSSPKQCSHSISSSAGSMAAFGSGPSLRRSAIAMQPADAVDSVPVAVQLTFMGLARAQRVRRRRLLLKGWSRWLCFLEVQAAHQWQLATAARHRRRRCLRRLWLAWLNFVQQQQYKSQHPDGLDHLQLKLLQQHSKAKQTVQLLQALQAWWAFTYRAAAARAAACAVATQKQQRLLRSILRGLHQHMQHSKHKQQLLIKAKSLRCKQLLQLSMLSWRQVVAQAIAADPSRNQALQQTLWRAMLHWKLLSAAAVAADGRQKQIKSFTARTAARRHAQLFAAWRLAAIQSAREQQQDQLQQTQHQFILLQQQSQDDQQQHAAGLKAVKTQMQQLQQQLEAALTSKAKLEEAAKTTEQQLQQQVSGYQQQLAQMSAEHHAAVAIMQQQVEQAARSTEDTAEQLEQLQQQQAAAAVEQQSKQQQVQQELEQYKQQQQQVNQREQDLQQQLLTSKSQSKQLAGQLKRCSEKLSQQTQAIQNLKAELEAAQQQVAAARHASRDKNLTLTHQALAAEREKLKSQQELCSEHAAVQVLKQQVQELEQQLQQQHKEAVAAEVQHGLEMERLVGQLGLKDQAVGQLQESMAVVQGQLGAEHAKVLAEVAQLRSGWSQAKQIIKQQRKTIKAQELQLQLALGGTAGMTPQTAHQQQYLAAVQLQEISGSGLGDFDALMAASDSNLTPSHADHVDADPDNEGKYPITGYILQQQPRRPVQTACAPSVVVHDDAPGADTLLHRRPAASLQEGLHRCSNDLMKQRHSSRRGTTVLHPPVTPGSSMGGLGIC